MDGSERAGGFFGNASIYIAGSIVVSILSLLTIKILTGNLSIGQYGQLSLFVQVIALTPLLISLGSEAPIGVDVIKVGPNSREFGQLVFSVLVMMTLVFGLLIITRENSLIRVFLEFIEFEEELWFRAIIVGYLIGIIKIGQSILLKTERALLLVTSRLLVAFLLLGFANLLVVGRKGGVIGAVDSYLIANATVGIIIAISLLAIFGIKFDFGVLKSSLSFSTPLIPHYVATWALISSDQFVISKQLTLEEVGIYSLGYSIASIIALVTSNASLAFSPKFMKIIKSERDNVDQINTFVRSYSYSLVVLICLFYSFTPILVEFLGSGLYTDSNDVIPLVIIGMYFQGMYMLCITPIFYEKRGVTIAIISVLSASLNIALNIILVGKYGISVAALSTAVCYSMQLFLTFWFWPASLVQRESMIGLLKSIALLLIFILIIGKVLEFGILIGTIAALVISMSVAYFTLPRIKFVMNFNPIV